MSKTETIKYALKNRSALGLHEVDTESLREAGCWDKILVLPEPLNERLTYLGDALVQSVKPKDDKLRFVMGRLCQSLSYMLNSASWREGELHEFDLDEIKRKLGSLAELEQTDDE